MKIIEVDEELYQFIASQTQSIGESASDILRRLLNLASSSVSSTALDFSQDRATQSPKEEPAENVSGSPKSAIEKPQNTAEKSPAQPINQPIQPELISDEMNYDPSVEQIEQDLRLLLRSSDFQQENKAVSRFLDILSALYQASPNSFATATESQQVQGRTRVYFARDQRTLLKAGNHTKPKQIPHSPYWVITNNNSGRKMIMLDGVMREMQLPESLIDDVRHYFVTN